jgi:hypothetical protein
MKLPRRQFLYLAAGAAALPALSRVHPSRIPSSKGGVSGTPFGELQLRFRGV